MGTNDDGTIGYWRLFGGREGLYRRRFSPGPPLPATLQLLLRVFPGRILSMSPLKTWSWKSSRKRRKERTKPSLLLFERRQRETDWQSEAKGYLWPAEHFVGVRCVKSFRVSRRCVTSCVIISWCVQAAGEAKAKRESFVCSCTAGPATVAMPVSPSPQPPPTTRVPFVVRANMTSRSVIPAVAS